MQRQRQVETGRGFKRIVCETLRTVYCGEQTAGSAQHASSFSHWAVTSVRQSPQRNTHIAWWSQVSVINGDFPSLCPRMWDWTELNLWTRKCVRTAGGRTPYCIDSQNAGSEILEWSRTRVGRIERTDPEIQGKAPSSLFHSMTPTIFWQVWFYM
jgi:hypothetical protein